MIKIPLITQRQLKNRHALATKMPVMRAVTSIIVPKGLTYPYRCQVTLDTGVSITATIVDRRAR